DFESKLSGELGCEILPLDKVTGSDAYSYSKDIVQGRKGNFIEVGAGGTKRIVGTRWTDTWKDASISFGSDFVTERLVKELDVDAVFSVVIDLDYNMNTKTLDPKVNIVAFAPNVSYKQPGKYFTMTAKSIPVGLSTAQQASFNDYQLMYKMVNAETLTNTFLDALKQLKAQEEKTPAYQALWDAKK
ncbi:MAG: hypothetical protein ACPGYY_09775, partial [Bacteroidia bacterium]